MVTQIKAALRDRSKEVNVVGMIYNGNGLNGEIGKMWGLFEKMVDMIPFRQYDYDDGESYGICYSLAGSKHDYLFHYMASVPVTNILSIPMPFVAKTIPTGKYAVLEIPDASRVQEALDYAVETWLPDIGYQRDGFFDFERYQSGEERVEVWVPVAPSVF